MRWVISGADRQTGFELKTTIEAETEDDAREQARRRGLLIEDVLPAGDAAPNQSTRPATNAHLGPSDLARASDTLLAFGRILMGIVWGLAILMIAVVIIFIAVAANWKNSTHGVEDLAGWNQMIIESAGLLFSMAGCLLSLFLVAAVLKWMAAMGHAVDAINQS